MTREEARKAAEVMLAYAEGKEIEFKDKDVGDNRFSRVLDAPGFAWNDYDYRIKPKTTYRPFKDAKECWDEMQKHKPFGWLRDETDEEPKRLVCPMVVDGNLVMIAEYRGGHFEYSYDDMFDDFTFADGTPFGIKTEE